MRNYANQLKRIGWLIPLLWCLSAGAVETVPATDSGVDFSGTGSTTMQSATGVSTTTGWNALVFCQSNDQAPTGVTDTASDSYSAVSGVTTTVSKITNA